LITNRSVVPPKDTDPKTPAHGEILFSSASERPLEPRTSIVFRTHPSLKSLAKAEQYIPLSMFSSAATLRLWKDFATLTMKKITLNDGTKISIVDPSQFPDEDLMSTAEFHESYQNLLAFQRIYGDTVFYERSYNHYRFLLGTQFFDDNFRTIKAFDKEERQVASYDPRVFDAERYITCFESIKAEVFRNDLKEEIAHSKRPSGPDRSDSSRFRFQPYHDSSSSNLSQRKPFQSGKSDTTPAGICLICAWTGHKFNACTYITILTDKGPTVWSK